MFLTTHTQSNVDETPLFSMFYVLWEELGDVAPPAWYLAGQTSPNLFRNNKMLLHKISGTELEFFQLMIFKGPNVIKSARYSKWSPLNEIANTGSTLCKLTQPNIWTAREPGSMPIN